MASTYSQNLKLELMGAGDQSGTWGDTTNTNLGTTLEEAVVGYGAVQFTNDANLTLTLSNSNTTQLARNFFLYVTSTVSLSATRDLIVPTIRKPYVVQNATTGGQAIQVRTAAGTGILVPSGKKMLLYVDGTNVIEQVNHFGGVSLTSPLGVPSGGTGAATLQQNSVLLGNGNGAVQTVAPGTSGNVLVSNGTSWVSQTSPGVTQVIAGAGMSVTPAGGTGVVTIATTGVSQITSGGGLVLSPLGGTGVVQATTKRAYARLMTSSGGGTLASNGVNSVTINFAAGAELLSSNMTVGSFTLDPFLNDFILINSVIGFSGVYRFDFYGEFQNTSGSSKTLQVAIFPTGSGDTQRVVIPANTTIQVSFSRLKSCSSGTTFSLNMTLPFAVGLDTSVLFVRAHSYWNMTYVCDL